MRGEGTKAKLKIKWYDLHYKSITLWHLHIVYLCNSKIFFFCHLPISIWACINMYKSLLRKNRIPRTALESLKGALSCFNFFSCSHETVSISARGVLHQLAPTKAQASSTLCPHDPQILPPPSLLSEMSGEREIQGQDLAVALELGAWHGLLM